MGELSKEPEIAVTSSDNNIIEANKTEEGKILLTAKNELGDVEITVKETNSNVTKTFSATTRIPATSLIISKESATIEPGKTLQLTATVEPSNTTDTITWTSTNTAIATVSNTGLVTGVNGGTSTITVTCGNLSKTCTIKAERFSGVNTSITNPEGALPSGTVTIVDKNLSNGIVIKDKNNREWVWIVVPKSVTASATTEAQIKEKLIAYAGVYRKGSSSQNYSWTDEWYNGCGITNETTYNTMYNKMLKSVYTNGGFWIQRYEDETHAITCANAQKKANGYAPDSTKTSSLLFGIQWDLVCKYLEGKDGLTQAMINSDSSSWGNYNGSSNPKQERNKKMNIYDFAGNLFEWTLEKTTSSSEPCVSRGGYYYTSPHTPASYRGDPCSTSYNLMYVTFRATFY